MRSFLAVSMALAAFAAAAPASALCSGESFEREYAEADLVVRARLVSERLVHEDEPFSVEYRRRWGEDSPVMIYRLEVSDVFKGRAADAETLFQVWHSGRFVMDQGQDYLLFLTRYPERAGQPSAERGATYVRHTCGQSKPWAELNGATRARLGRLPPGGPQ
jgi:hypothetical protein